MRDIKYIDKIIVHCSASDNPDHDDISVIKKWHIARGFAGVGYHYFITSRGELQIGRDCKFIGAHCTGNNLYSIGICMSGKNHFSEACLSATAVLIRHTMRRFNIPINKVLPHNFFDNTKTCPNITIEELMRHGDIIADQ